MRDTDSLKIRIPFIRSHLLNAHRWEKFLPNEAGTVFISYSRDSPDYARAVLPYRTDSDRRGLIAS
jgi:hypothetical protein